MRFSIRWACLVAFVASCARDRGAAPDAGVAAAPAPSPSFSTHSVAIEVDAGVVDASASDAAAEIDFDDDEPAAPPAVAPSGSGSGSGSGSKAPPKEKPVPVRKCRMQKPLPFLVRGNYYPIGEHKEVHDKAIKFRTEHYGFVKGFGLPEWNAHPPDFYAENITFLGLPIRFHKRVAPALRCVEASIKKFCKAETYKPERLAGIRFDNTYRAGEVTNHVYGVAIDVDPHRNTCCKCVPPWRDHPLCKNKSLTIYERMAMPKCWVKEFEKYGFYWLGHDRLEDTMHFEFLGDPDKILAGK